MRSISVALGTFSGFGVVALLEALLSPEAMQGFGWRICFWLGLLVGLVGLFLRHKAVVFINSSGCLLCRSLSRRSSSTPGSWVRPCDNLCRP